MSYQKSKNDVKNCRRTFVPTLLLCLHLHIIFHGQVGCGSSENEDGGCAIVPVVAWYSSFKGGMVIADYGNNCMIEHSVAAELGSTQGPLIWLLQVWQLTSSSWVKLELASW